jgi:hypothetical protein
MLDTPPHIARSGIAAHPLSYAWDEWAIKSYYWDVSQSLFDRLNALSDDASMSLALAVGEWVVHRFDAFSKDAEPLQFLEAAWAGTVHPYHCVYTETVDDEWRGPVRGPLAITITIANDGLFCRDADPEVATRACWMHRLATHVLADPAPFDVWFEACVQRLERFYPRIAAAEPESFFGLNLASHQPVPREAFDLSQNFDPARAPQLVDNFLRSLDPSANPSLRPADQLQDLPEFPGTPYRYAAD